MASGGDNFEFGLFLLVAGAGIVFAGIRRFQRKRKYEDTPHIEIASAPQGLVELSGFAWAKTLQHNLEGRAIAFVSWQLEKLVQRNKKTEWVIVARGTNPDGFILQDESGAAWINTKDALFDCSGGQVHEWKRISHAGQLVFLSWLRAQGIPPVLDGGNFPPTDGFFTSRYRIRSEEFAIGNPVVAQGTFHTNRKEATQVLAGLSLFKERHVKLSRNAGHSLSMMDSNQDGVIDEQEHRLGYVLSAESTARKLEMAPTRVLRKREKA